jgi:hypothetical protein
MNLRKMQLKVEVKLRKRSLHNKRELILQQLKVVCKYIREEVILGDQHTILNIVMICSADQDVI